MNWTAIAQTIFTVCIVPLLGVLTTYIVTFLRKKSEALQNEVDNENLRHIIERTEKIICSCVITTNQTYVEALKDKNAFDAENQAEAFRRTYEAVMSQLSEDTKATLSATFGDLAAYITSLIESKVNLYK